MKTIARLRKLRGWTQMDLAHEIGVNQSTISKAEKGDGGVSLVVYRDIAETLGVQMHELFAPDARSTVEAKMLEAFRGLPLDRQEKLIDLIRDLTPPLDAESQ